MSFPQFLKSSVSRIVPKNVRSSVVYAGGVLEHCRFFLHLNIEVLQISANLQRSMVAVLN